MDTTLVVTPNYRSTCFDVNSDLFDLMDALVSQDQRWKDFFKLTPQISAFLAFNFEFKRRLLSTTMLCVIPSINSVNDWDCLFNGDTAKLNHLFVFSPSVNQQLATEIKYQNKFYLRHLIQVARTQPLAAIDLGIPPAIIELLRNITATQQNNAARLIGPLFTFRYTDAFFAPYLLAEKPLRNVKSNKPPKTVNFNELHFLDFLIQTSPLPLSSMPNTSNIGHRYHNEVSYPLAEHLVRFQMRATIISSFLPEMHEAKLRDMYQRINHESSVCGKLPSSVNWHFESETRRSNSSFFILLYRFALVGGNDHIHSIIAAYSWYRDLIKVDPMSLNRLGILANTLQSGGGDVFVGACRTCRSNYLLCNTDDKREFSNNFHCVSCAKKIKQAAA